MKVHVNLFKPSGKWAYGDLVSISGVNSLGSEALMQELVDNQGFVVDGAFDNYTVVVTHTDDWYSNSEPGFFQHLFPLGSFLGIRKRIKA